MPPQEQVDDEGRRPAVMADQIGHEHVHHVRTRSLEFYTRQLGFEVSTDQPFTDKQRWIELRIANSATRVVLFTPDGHEDRIGTSFNGAFACDDVQATYRQLSARGVEFIKPPQKQPWGEFAIFKDPDGNQFVMSSS